MFFIHVVELAKETFVELVVSDNKEGVVDVLFDNVGVNHKACGSGVEDDVVIALS